MSTSIAKIGIKKELNEANFGMTRDTSFGDLTSKISLDKQKSILADQSKTNPVIINSGFDNYDNHSLQAYDDNLSMVHSQKNSILPNSITLH